MTVETVNAIRMSRTIRAGRQAVWDAWTQPEHMKKWACPAPDGVKSIDADLRVGGSFRLVMEVPDGRFTAFGTYREVDEPNRLVYTWDWEEEDHRMGVATVVTVDFIEKDDATEVVLTHAGFPALEAKQGHEEGWGACLGNFEGLFG